MKNVLWKIIANKSCKSDALKVQLNINKNSGLLKKTLYWLDFLKSWLMYIIWNIIANHVGQICEVLWLVRAKKPSDIFEIKFILGIFHQSSYPAWPSSQNLLPQCLHCSKTLPCKPYYSENRLNKKSPVSKFYFLF